jgi:hypothetical protein
MNGDLWALGEPSFTESLTVASGALLQWALQTPATRGTTMKDKNRKQNPKNTNEQQVFLETRNGTSGVAGNYELPRLRKVTAMR